MLSRSRRDAVTADWKRSISTSTREGSILWSRGSSSSGSKRMTGPMPIPGDAPMPSNFTSRPRPSGRGSRLAPELAVHQLPQLLDRLLGVRPLGAHADRAALLGRQHHHAHDALAVDLEIVARHEDLRLESRRGL